MKLLTFLSIASIVIAGGTLELTGVSVNDEIQFNFTVGSSNEEIMLTGVSEQNAVFINRNDDGSCHHESASVLCGYSLTGDSKTLKQSDSRFSNNWYTGNWATDDFTIGTKTLKQMPFGLSKPEVVNITTNSGKVVLTGLKSSFGYGLSTNSSDISDHSFIKHLVDTDTIDRSLFSVHPLKKTAAGQLQWRFLYGGVDQAKYGRVSTLSLTPPRGASALIGSIPLRNMYLETGDSIERLTDGSDYSVDLRYSYSAVTDLKVPSSVWKKLASSLKLTPATGPYGTSSGPCVSEATLVFEFSDVVKIRIPLKDLQSTTSGETCSMRMYGGSSETNFFFGPALMEYIYAVYDVDKFEVSIAQMEHNEDTAISSVGKNAQLPDGKVTRAESSSTSPESKSTPKENHSNPVNLALSLIVLSTMIQTLLFF
ncbi:hypothetical protein DICA4_C10044 [Diutina catenulata]